MYTDFILYYPDSDQDLDQDLDPDLDKDQDQDQDLYFCLALLMTQA